MAAVVLGFIAGGLKKQVDPKGREKRGVAPKTIRLLAPQRHHASGSQVCVATRDSNPPLSSVDALTHQRG